MFRLSRGSLIVPAKYANKAYVKINSSLNDYVTVHHKWAVKSAFSLFEILDKQTLIKISFKMIYCVSLLLITQVVENQ
jgi:hypothetical protein